MKGVSNIEQLEQYAKQLAPMGQMGMKMFQNFMEECGEGHRRRIDRGTSEDSLRLGLPWIRSSRSPAGSRLPGSV